MLGGAAKGASADAAMSLNSTDVAAVVDPAADLRVIEIDPQSDKRWECFVGEHADGLIYHHPLWLRVLQREFGSRGLCLACEDSTGTLHGILPLMWTRGLPLVSDVRMRRRLSSLPRTPIAGPLASHSRATDALVRAAIELVDRSRGARLELKPSWAQPLHRTNAFDYVPWRKTYVLHLPENAHDLRLGTSRNRARINWAIRKAKKLGVEVRPAHTREELLRWYPLYLETMQQHTVPPRPFRLFEAMWDVLRPRGLMRLLLAVENGQPIAGSIYLMFGHTVFYAFNGSRQSSLKLRPNDAIQLQAIEDSCSDGFRYYDLGEVANDNEGLAQFKSKWGAEEVQLYRGYIPRVVESDLPAGVAEPTFMRVGKAVWRSLPLRATSAFGDALYRFL